MSAYLTVAEAATYFSERLHSIDWDDADSTSRTKALATATRVIDRLNFSGDKTDANQALEFPRGGDTAVPSDIQAACCEIAIELLSGRDLNYERDAMRETHTGYGAARVGYDATHQPEHLLNGVPSMLAWGYLKPFLRDPNTVTLSRIN